MACVLDLLRIRARSTDDLCCISPRVETSSSVAVSPTKHRAESQGCIQGVWLNGCTTTLRNLLDVHVE